MKSTRHPKPITPIPKWYNYKDRRLLKRMLIEELINEYKKPTKLSSKNTYKPSELDIKEYITELYKLKIKDLLEIKAIKEAKPRLSFVDKVSKIKKRKALLVTIYHKNGSRTHYICSKHTRILKVNEYTYLCPPNKGNFDNKYGMMSYSYYENNPFPIEFRDDFTGKTEKGETVPDSELMKSTMDFEFAQKLAHSSLNKKVDIALVFSILAFVIGVVNTFLLVKIGGWI